MTTADPAGKRHRSQRRLNRLDQAAASIFYVLTGILLGAQLVHRYETLFAFGLMFGAFAAIYFTVFRPVERPQRDGLADDVRLPVEPAAADADQQHRNTDEEHVHAQLEPIYPAEAARVPIQLTRVLLGRPLQLLVRILGHEATLPSRLDPHHRLSDRLTSQATTSVNFGAPQFHAKPAAAPTTGRPLQ